MPEYYHIEQMEHILVIYVLIGRHQLFPFLYYNKWYCYNMKEQDIHLYFS